MRSLRNCTISETVLRVLTYFDSEIIAYFIALSIAGVSLSKQTGQTWLRVYVVMHSKIKLFSNIFTSFCTPKNI